MSSRSSERDRRADQSSDRLRSFLEGRRLSVGVAVVVVVVLLMYFTLVTGLLGPLLGGYDPHDPGGYDHVTVAAIDGETGIELGSVEAAVADTTWKRYVGLSGVDPLPEDRGMLFVHDDDGRYTYVMRNVDVDLDVVFVASDGTITTIHHATAPDRGVFGFLERYSGQGQYVLEVNYGWTDDHDVEVGDRLTFGLSG